MPTGRGKRKRKKHPTHQHTEDNISRFLPPTLLPCFLFPPTKISGRNCWRIFERSLDLENGALMQTKASRVALHCASVYLYCNRGGE